MAAGKEEDRILRIVSRTVGIPIKRGVGKAGEVDRIEATKNTGRALAEPSPHAETIRDDIEETAP